MEEAPWVVALAGWADIVRATTRLEATNAPAARTFFTMKNHSLSDD
jgi:hypothetical protein